MQRDYRQRRTSGACLDTLLLVEHPPVYTCGRGSSPQEFLTSPDVLRRSGFGVHEIERGGKTTYHGPGQLVGYPIVSLTQRGLSVRQYVALLEQCLIETLQEMGLEAVRRPGNPGVWLGPRKIAALGVHIRQGVTMHGFALNLNPDLSHFSHIVSCGIEDATVTSVLVELGRCPSMSDAKASVVARLRAALSAS